MGIIPPGAVVEEGMAVPEARGFGVADRVEVIACAAPRPIGPALGVAVMHGIVVHIVQRRPKMGLGADAPVGGAVKHGATGGALCDVPRARGAAVEAAKC